MTSVMMDSTTHVMSNHHHHDDNSIDDSIDDSVDGSSTSGESFYITDRLSTIAEDSCESQCSITTAGSAAIVIMAMMMTTPPPPSNSEPAKSRARRRSSEEERVSAKIPPSIDIDCDLTPKVNNNSKTKLSISLTDFFGSRTALHPVRLKGVDDTNTKQLASTPKTRNITLLYSLSGEEVILTDDDEFTLVSCSTGKDYDDELTLDESIIEEDGNLPARIAAIGGGGGYYEEEEHELNPRCITRNFFPGDDLSCGKNANLIRALERRKQLLERQRVEKSERTI
jgi:hypothetical protein